MRCFIQFFLAVINSDNLGAIQTSNNAISPTAKIQNPPFDFFDKYDFSVWHPLPSKMSNASQQQIQHPGRNHSV